MYEQLKNKLQQELKTLQHLQLKINVMSSSGKKVKSENHKEKSQKITGKSMFSLQQDKSFKRNLLKDFENVQNIQDGSLFQNQLLGSKHLQSSSSSSERKNKQVSRQNLFDPEDIKILKPQINKKKDHKKRKNSFQGFSKQKKQLRITSAQKNKKLQIELELLKRVRLLEKHLKRYGLKL